MNKHCVISDLHLGMGKTDAGDWYGLEDFKSDDAFTRFLHHLDRENVDELIINGDWIDFAQLEPLPLYDTPHFSDVGHRLGWIEAESLQKLENCAATRAHKSFFDDLKSFLASGRKVTVLMGNHDPDLFWPSVQSQLYSLLAPPKPDSLRFEKRYIRRGSAHIEHGNQRCSPENAFADPLNTFHKSIIDGQLRLEMVWGTQFVCEYFNKIEAQYPFADNIKPEYRALWLGFKNRWIHYKQVVEFVKFLNGAGIPWKTLAEGILSEKGPRDLIIGVGDPQLTAEILKRYAKDPEFRKAFDAEVKNTDQMEWKAIASSEKPHISYEELQNLEESAEVMGLIRKALEYRAAESILENEEVEFLIFGHTHSAIDGAVEKAVVPNYFNTGTWTNSLDLRDPDVRARFPKISLEDLKDETLFNLRLNYVLIEVDDAGSTSVKLCEF